MMSKKGVGSVVAYIILILLAIVGVSIFLGAYFKSIDKSTSDETASCFGIDLKVNNCVVFPKSLLTAAGLPDTGNGTLMGVERLPGGKEVTGMRFIFINLSGATHVEKPVDFEGFGLSISTNYTSLLEYETIDAAVRNLDYHPLNVAVAAVVGKDTVCTPTREPVICEGYRPI